MIEEQPVLIAMQVADFPVSPPGSTTVVCAKCGALVWVSPASRPLLERVSRVECNRCNPLDAIPLDEVEMPTPEQQAEIEAAQGPPSMAACRLCREQVPRRLRSMREHLMGHRPGAGKCTARQVMAEFRR